MTDTDTGTPIGRDDLEARFQAFKDDVDRSADRARSRLLPATTVVALVLLVLAYLVGKRVGKTKSTVVEIRRI
ncbi:MAG: hypothetical protein ACE5GB_09215 [Acidimicrobiales bacterium]